MLSSVDSKYFQNNSCQRICIAYEEHSYVICMSNKKVYVVKKRNPAAQQTQPVMLSNVGVHSADGGDGNALA